MRDVAVAGVGMLPFTRAAAEPAPVSAARVAAAALADAGICWGDVDLVVGGTLSADLTATWQAIHELPWTGVAGLTVTNASATGSSAFRQAYLAVASGSCDVAVAVGFGELDGGLLAAAGSGSRLPELTGANLPPVVFGLLKARRMHEYGEPAETAALVAVKNFGNAARNPDAQRQRTVTVDEVMASPVVSDPLRRLECCPLGTGAAAAVLTADAAHGGVRVAASVAGSDGWHPAAPFAPDPEVTAKVARQAYREAGIGPEALDVVEVHDAFAVEELVYCEALGLCDAGEAAAWLAAGEFDIGGRVAVSPSGGLLARGHPGGATGLAQIVEAVRQLRGQAGSRQQPGAQTALTHMIGAGGACVIHVLSADGDDR
ncbi:MAG TPA: thiolase family protein [Mycobacteriales bacterium]|nr:thiolase family protein [Mycobacteriales bacterium]